MELPVPRLLDPAAVPRRAATACFDAVVNAHLRAAPQPDRPRPARTPAPEGLRAVFAAHVPSGDGDHPTPIAHASAFRAPGEDVTYLCGGHRSPGSRTWFATTLHPPTRPAAATWQRFVPSGQPGGGISHFHGHADDDVAAVVVRTADGAEHCAPAAGGVWWTAAWLDESTERTAGGAGWRAVAADGRLLASGTGVEVAEDGEPAPPTDPALLPVLRELQAREPLFHRPELGTGAEDLEQQMAPDFFEVGASGRRYDRQHVKDVLLRRYAEGGEDPWQTSGFHCRALGADTYLLTYVLRQGRRLTRRVTAWRRTPQGWQVLYHQGTPIT